MDFMKCAMKCAYRASEHDDVPIGAVIVQNGRIIARGENKVQMKKNPMLHAEIVALSTACKKLGKKFLDDCEIFITLEPCAMCAAALSFARIKRITFAAPDEKGGGILHNAHLFDTDKHLWKPVINVDEKYGCESAKMLREFFKSKRN